MTLIHRINFLACGFVAAEGIALLIAILLLRRHTTSMARIAHFILIILALRFVMFATPLSWGAYFSVLGPPDIDWREKDIEANRVKSFLHPRVAHPYVVVGSSQTWAIYSSFAKTHPKIEPYFLAGMGPIDYVQEYSRIRSLQPKRIVFYISEFDLARPVVTTGVNLSTLPITDYLSFYNVLKQVIPPAQARDVMMQKAVVDEFPEFKYRFVPNGAINLIERHILAPPPQPEAVGIARQMESMEHLSVENIPRQLTLVRAFLTRAQQDHIPVTIVEGQYNPQAYTAENIAIHTTMIKPQLQALTKEFSNVSLLTRQDTGEFTVDDYNDVYHVKTQAGERFAAHVLALLDTQHPEIKQ